MKYFPVIRQVIKKTAQMLGLLQLNRAKNRETVTSFGDWTAC